MTIVLEARGVSKAFGHRLVVADTSLAIEAGRMIAVVGRSGSGKTTLLSLLAGFTAPDGGSIARASESWRDIAVVPQTLGLLDELTATENVASSLRLRGMPRREAEARSGAVLAELGLEALGSRFAGEMSAGQRQRVAVARAIVGDPVVVLADEPTSHLDGTARTLVTDAIRRRVAGGMAAVLVTHDPLVRAAADQVVEIGGIT